MIFMHNIEIAALEKSD